jgi:tetratricopeptide (TPR) repeat protein
MDTSDVTGTVTADRAALDAAMAERQARLANSPDLWNRLWKDKDQEEWRKQALSQVYTRIERILPYHARVVDLGGGTGVLGARLRDTRKANVLVVDHSTEALQQAKEKDLETVVADLNQESEIRRALSHRALVGTNGDLIHEESPAIVVATEFVEHMSAETRALIFKLAAQEGRALLSVPNDRLGPDEEPQHTVKYNAMSFKRDLAQYFKDVRIEVLGPYLLAVCGFPKSFTLSVTMPVRDEAEDLEATLASFRGVADEMVIGIDPRTVDNTREIAEKYADVVFDLDQPSGPPKMDLIELGEIVSDEEKIQKQIHFAWVRNQCLDHCTSDWIFMTEGHERLISGFEALLGLDQMPKGAKVGVVFRTGTGQRWVFPWLCRNDPKIRYTRGTHNTLDYPPDYLAITLPQVQTLHERAKDRELARQKQRKVQNRKSLMDDWITNRNENSLHYLGAEWREHDPKRAIARLEEFLSLPPKNGPLRYHTRLVLAKLYTAEQQWGKAREVLIRATEDDWSRTEHWLRLGDLAYIAERYEEALSFYLYASTTIGQPPFTIWWIDMASYTWLPCQRLTTVFAELGKLDESLYYARRVLELLPDDAESVAFEEAQANIKLLEETLNAAHRSNGDPDGPRDLHS